MKKISFLFAAVLLGSDATQAAPTTVVTRYQPFHPRNSEPIEYTIAATNSGGLRSIELYLYEYNWQTLDLCQRRSNGRWGLAQRWNLTGFPKGVRRTFTGPGFSANTFVSFLVVVKPKYGAAKTDYWGFAAGDWAFGNLPIPIWVKPPPRSSTISGPGISTSTAVSTDRINMVFVAQTGEYTTPRDMLGDLQVLVFDLYHSAPEITMEKALWAFHYSPEFGNISGTSTLDIPASTAAATNIYPNAAAVVHQSNKTDFRIGGFFGTEFNSWGTCLHELGHAVFDLRDEYASGFHWRTPLDHDNNYASLQDCRNYNAANGWPAGDCNEVVAGQWWTPEPAAAGCVMRFGVNSPQPHYAHSCMRRVRLIYDLIK